MTKTDYSESKVNELLVGKTAFALPSVWVALYTVAPTDAAASGTEVTGGAYVRKATVAADWANSVSGSPSSIANANPLTFVTATASWGTVVAFALLDAATGGNMLIYATLTTSKTIGTGDTASFAVGALVHTED
jgi:hypothetical protein